MNLRRYTVFLSSQELLRTSLRNLDMMQKIMIFRTTLVKQTMSLICSQRLKKNTQSYREREREDTVFSSIGQDDLIMAFFPCIYFTGSTNPCYYTLENTNYRGLTDAQKFEKMIERMDNRNYFYKLLYKLCGICVLKKVRLVIENPYSALHYLHNNFLKEPSIIDSNRQKRGDYFVKPTGYWFFNFEPSYGESFQRPEKKLNVWDCNGAKEAGLCSEERSMISPDYARNFICDFILGKVQDGGQQSLFEE